MEKIIEKLRAIAAGYAADEYQRFEDELGWQPWMEAFTDAADGEVCTVGEIEAINQVLRRAWDDAHLKTVWYVENDCIEGNPSWDTLSGIYDNEAAAISSAQDEWRHLTDKERANRVIRVLAMAVPGDVGLDEAMDYSGDGAWLVKEFRL